MAFVINGKFTSQRITGVQRVACELTRALNARGLECGDLALVVPRNARAAQSAHERRRVCGWLTGNLWEQLALPLATRTETLISLCNTGPLFKRRHVVMIHDMAIYDSASAFTRKFRLWYRLVFSMLSKNSLHLLTVSSFSRERIVHHLRVPASRVSVIRPAVDHFERIASERQVLARLDLRPQNYCLMVGSLDPRKNLARGLAAIDKVVCPPGFKFVLAGGSNSRVFGATHHNDEPASTRIVSAGFVTDGELKALYENATCFVFPSLYEGFGLPPLEAMYCGCPVIASREASLPEVCGDAAMYCDANSIDDIASKLALMLGDPELREMYRQRGLVQARSYGWREAAGQLRDALAYIEDANAAVLPSAKRAGNKPPEHTSPN
jgi:glycosyltransferase involved in cell wall biosynthesis